MNENSFITYLQSQPETAETKQMIDYFKNQIKFKNQSLHFQDKFRVVMSFIKFMKTMCLNSNPKIYGSFTRNIFEKLFIHTSDIGYGDPVNHDIDIMVYSYKDDYIDEIQPFSDFISLLRIISNNTTFDFDFYGFKVVDVIENTIKANDITDVNGFAKKFLMNIPHYTIILNKDNIKIKLDLIAYKSQDYEFDSWQNEFNINSLSLSEEGILIKKNSGMNINNSSYNLFEIINSIMNKNAICNMPFMDIIDGFMNKTRSQKVTILNQIIWFIMNRLKILTLGYNEIYSEINSVLIIELEEIGAMFDELYLK
jgi:N-acetylneuraminic acid mutarotase